MTFSVSWAPTTTPDPLTLPNSHSRTHTPELTFFEEEPMKPSEDRSDDQQSAHNEEHDEEHDEEGEDSSPPGAGHKDGSGHSDGREEPYDEEPE
jgi:hypothetical protein